MASAEIVQAAQLTRDEAQVLTQAVREDVRALWMKVLDLYERGAHHALGYANWGEYWEGEFGQSGARGEQLVRAGRVARALGSADVPLPANDLIARALLPVMRAAPDDLPDVWSRAVQATGGKPTAKQVREFVAPYAERVARARPDDPESWAKRGATRRRRNLAALPLSNARAHAANALANLGDALDDDLTPDVLQEWRENAEAGAHDLARVRDRINERLSGNGGRRA